MLCFILLQYFLHRHTFITVSIPRILPPLKEKEKKKMRYIPIISWRELSAVTLAVRKNLQKLLRPIISSKRSQEVRPLNPSTAELVSASYNQLVETHKGVL